MLRKAIAARLKKSDGVDDTGRAAVLPPPVGDFDEAIGIPRDEYAFYRSMGHAKLAKIYTFLSHGTWHGVLRAQAKQLYPCAIQTMHCK